MKRPALFIGSTLVFGTFAQAAQPSCHRVDDFSFPQALSYAKAKLANINWGTNPGPATNVLCGQVITADTKLNGDLDCSSTTGFVVKIEGNGIKFDGHGHKIIAPNAAAGIFVQGSNDIVTNTQVSGVTQGYGIFAYDSPGIQIVGNIVTGNMIGIIIDAENVTLSGAAVTNNYAVGNSQFGVRVAQDGAGSVVNPIININDFSNSGSYAISVQATSYEMSNLVSLNVVSGSLDGIYLKTGSFNIHDFSFSLFGGAQNAQIAVDSAASVQMKSVDVSTNIPPNAAQERIGVDFYRVANFSISKLTAKGNDVGVKLETDSGISTAGSIQGCSFSNNDVAGVMIVSYDQTPFGVLTVSNNSFNESGSALQILLESGTSLETGSLLGLIQY